MKTLYLWVIPLCLPVAIYGLQLHNSRPTVQPPATAPVPAKPIVSNTYKAQQTDAIREALLRSEVPASVGACNVVFRHPPPTPAFIQRMRAFNIYVHRVLPNPEYVYKVSPYPQTQGQSVLGLRVFPIRWLGSSRVQVKVDRSVPQLNYYSGSDYTLARKNGKWMVVSRKATQSI
jgi:hypothetical protein